jgi:soluble lytic murein transglycosylase-like protein
MTSRAAAALAALALLAAPAHAASTQWQAALEAAIRAGDYVRAAQEAQKAHALDPDDPVSAAWAGVSWALAGHPARARPWLLRAEALDRGGRTGAVARAWLASAAATYDPAKEAAIARLAASTNRSLRPDQAAWIARAVMYAASLYRLDPLLLAAVVHFESRWNHASVSRAGALGLAQLMPSTARGIGVDPRHPLHNLLGAARLLRGHLNAFRDAPDPLAAALSAYNAGSGATRRAGGVPPNGSVAAYVHSVTRLYVELARSLR